MGRHVFAEDLVDIWQLCITRKRSNAMLATLLEREYSAKQCRGICDGVHKGTMPLVKELQDRLSREAMVQVAQQGHHGQPPWTNMTIDALECVSFGCHAVGFFVGYCGYNANNHSITTYRKGHSTTFGIPG